MISLMLFVLLVVTLLPFSLKLLSLTEISRLLSGVVNFAACRHLYQKMAICLVKSRTRMLAFDS